MNLNFDVSLAGIYTNNSQKARVLTEAWVHNEIYCPNCGNKIASYANNKPVADFYCIECSEDFELKSKKGKMASRVSAGAYSKMILSINSAQKPNFFFMAYALEKLKVDNFFVVPKHFFISDIIEKRNPLSVNAKRAGWVGSNILFSKIPKLGHIYYIENGKEVEKKQVLENWKKTLFVKEIKKETSKGWIFDVMNCIDSLNKKEFSLQEIYAYEQDLFLIHPENNNIKPKIRQQLQFLRDKGYLEFVENGKYKLK